MVTRTLYTPLKQHHCMRALLLGKYACAGRSTAAGRTDQMAWTFRGGVLG